MVEGLLIADVETKRLTRANPAICRMLGYSQDRTAVNVGTRHPLLRRHMADTLRAFPGGSRGADSFEAQTAPLLRKDGSVFFADIVSHTLIYGGRQCLVGFFRDITERRRAEEALAESEAKYRHLVETTDTGYLILDEEGRVVDANDEYVRLTGRHRLADIMGRRVVEWTVPQDAERNAEEVAKCLKEADPFGNWRLDYIGPDGKIIPIEINASVVSRQTRQTHYLAVPRHHRSQAGRGVLRQSEAEIQGPRGSVPRRRHHRRREGHRSVRLPPHLGVSRRLG